MEETVDRSASARGCALMLVTALAFATTCGRQERPDVVIITFDTTRYDRFGCTGDPTARTPVVDGLAAAGTLFEHAYASVPLTLPSHTTIMTGLEPAVHGVHDNGHFRVPDAVDTLAERLGRTGYDTAAFVSAFVLDARFNLGQGFAVYRDGTHPETGPLNFSVPRRPGEEVTNEALDWLAGRHADRPFFLWAHYYDPHQPHTVKPPFDDIPDTYAAAIAYDDAQLGRLLESVRRAAASRPVLIVVTADHGESQGEHGEATHGLVAYDSTLHVPLVVTGPGFTAKARATAFARHVDIVPTVLEAAGLPPDPALPGRTLRAVAGTPAGDESVVGAFENLSPRFDLGWAAIEGVRTARWKYTAVPEPPELYDVLADPGERENRIAEAPDVREWMEAARRRLLAAAPIPRAPSDGISPEVAERLAALGYVEAAARGSGVRPDPRRLVAAYYWADGARVAAGAGRYDEAIETLETLANTAALKPLVLRSLADVYAVAGRFEDAIRTYRAYIELTGAQEAHLALARLYVQIERPGDALGELDALATRSPAGETLRAYALGHLGRQAEARAAIDAAFADVGTTRDRLRQRAALVLETAPLPDGEAELRRLLQQAPGDATLQSRLGYYLAVWGTRQTSAEATRFLSTAAGAAPDDAEVQGNLGWGLHQQGNDDGAAAAALERALELDPGRHLDRLRLALVLERQGEKPRARALLREALALWPGARWADRARAALARLDVTEE
jgi:arylsulfatase A-like enzyme/Flp pilus assembly protein TadD